ncbi:MAG: acyl-CoA dehydrogenase family protein [Myxococcota bacterium]
MTTKVHAEQSQDGSSTDEERSFRAEVRAFLDRALPPERRFKNHSLDRQTFDSTRWWHQTLAAQGWGAPSWPKAYGGTGWTVRQQSIFSEECAEAGAPLLSPFGLVMVGPVIFTFGSDAQKQKFLPPIIDASVMWCQGYSEPGSGSDLASLNTQAVRDGDHYIVNGQKTWTTQAQWADWIFCLVRTNNESRPQAGISFILIDMKSPGVEVRPIYTIDGMHHLNEVFLTDVKVPVENRVGDENAGWTYAKFLLTNERAGIAAVANSRTELKRLRALSMSQEHFASPPGHDSYFQDKFADLENRLASLAALEARALAEPEGTLEAMMLGSPLKLLGSHIMQDLAELSVELVGPAALPEVGADSVYGSEGTSLMTSHLLGRAHTIYGGTSEVQKNVISKLIASVS